MDRKDFKDNSIKSSQIGQNFYSHTSRSIY